MSDSTATNPFHGAYYVRIQGAAGSAATIEAPWLTPKLKAWLKTVPKAIFTSFASNLGVDADDLANTIGREEQPDAKGPPPFSEEAARAEESVRASARASDNALRDMLIEKDGHRLAPAIRTWATSQSSSVVKGLLSAAPSGRDAERTGTRVFSAADERRRGGGLKGKDLEDLQRGLGTYQSPHREPYTDPATGTFVLPSTPPREAQKLIEARAARGGR